MSLSWRCRATKCKEDSIWDEQRWTMRCKAFSTTGVMKRRMKGEAYAKECIATNEEYMDVEMALVYRQQVG